jgi:hypothetical protein
VIYKGHSCFLLFLRLIILTIKTSVLFCCIFSRCNTLDSCVLRQIYPMSLQILRPRNFSCLEGLYSSNITGNYRQQISVLTFMNPCIVI